MRWGVVENTADGREHAVEVVEDVVVPEAKDTVTVSCELVSAAVIGIFIDRVLATVEFNDEFCLRTGEVDDAVADRVLAAKFPCGEALA